MIIAYILIASIYVYHVDHLPKCHHKGHHVQCKVQKSPKK